MWWEVNFSFHFMFFTTYHFFLHLYTVFPKRFLCKIYSFLSCRGDCVWWGFLLCFVLWRGLMYLCWPWTLWTGREHLSFYVCVCMPRYMHIMCLLGQRPMSVSSSVAFHLLFSYLFTLWVGGGLCHGMPLETRGPMESVLSFYHVFIWDWI